MVIVNTPAGEREAVGGCTVRKILADYAVCDRRRYCKALCDVKFSQIEGNSRTFCHIEISNSVVTVYTLLEKFWWISLYVVDDAIAKLHVTQSLVK